MGPQDRREAEGADSAAAVRGGDPGGDRHESDCTRVDPAAAQERHGEVLRRRRHAQTQAAREAERRKKADEAGRDCGDTSGSVPRSAPGGVGGLMRSTIIAAVTALSVMASSAAAAQAVASRPTPFTVNQIRSYPFPNELTAAATGSRLAWAFNEQGRRNIHVAEGPAFSARQLTHYDRDDGQELSSVAVSADGKWVVYVRGGDHGSNWDDELPVNVGSNPAPPKVQIFSVSFDGGEPKAIGDGDEPVVSPRSDVVAFIKGNQIWTASIAGSAPAKALFTVRGETGDPRWSPDGSRLAFVANRGDHAFIGVYINDSTPVTWLAPAFARDRSPRWSPDGRRIAFVRLPGTGGAPDSLLPPRPNPWEIWTADATTGAAERLWKSPATLAGSGPTTDGSTNLGWGGGANDRLVFLSYQDGWPHLYSIPATAGQA